MKRFFKFFKGSTNQRGFTLIELLVVIGILGVLAAALVATIDPFEQLKKANDANTKNTAVEYINANIRYYTTHNAMPWGLPSGACLGSSPTGATLGSLTTCLQDLVSDGEIKSAFTTVTGVLNQVIVSGTDNAITACFKPQSKAEINDPNTKYNSTGSGNCPSLGGTDCYWCSQ